MREGEREGGIMFFQEHLAYTNYLVVVDSEV